MGLPATQEEQEEEEPGAPGAARRQGSWSRCHAAPFVAVGTPQPAGPRQALGPLSPSSVSSPRGERETHGDTPGVTASPGTSLRIGVPPTPPPCRRVAPSCHFRGDFPAQTGPVSPAARSNDSTERSSSGMNPPSGNRFGEAKGPPRAGIGLTCVPDWLPSARSPHPPQIRRHSVPQTSVPPAVRLSGLVGCPLPSTTLPAEIFPGPRAAQPAQAKGSGPRRPRASALLIPCRHL